MTETEVTWKKVFTIWWSYVWRTALLTLGFGFILGLIGGLVAALLKRPEIGKLTIMFASYLLPLVVSLLVFKMILGKRYKEFSLKLISEETTPDSIAHHFKDISGQHSEEQ